MKKKLLWNIALILVFILLLFCEVLTVATVIRLDMLPDMYLFAVIGVLALFALLIGLLLFVPGKGPGKGRRIVACVLTLIMVCGCAVIITVATDVMNTLAASSREEEAIATREIFVRVDDTAQELSDLSHYTIGYVKNYDEACTQQVIDAVNAETEVNVATAGYTNMFTMVSALLENRIDAMILNSGYVEFLEETEEFLDFSTRARILSAITVVETESMMEEIVIPDEEVEEPSTEETVLAETEPTEEEINFETLEPFIVYVSGSDTRSTTLKGGRSDVNILAVVNPMTKQVLLVNTPRDYYIKNSAGNWAYDKLTHCGIYGISCSMKSLGKLYDQDVDYYVQINFSGFRKLINSMGGITVYSDKSFTAMNRTKIVKGMNELTGGQALDFARDRKSHIDGDNARGRNQMQVIKAVIQKATSGSTIIANYAEIMESMEGMFKMSVPTELISTVMKMQLSDMAQWNVVTYAATGYNDGAICYSMPSMKLSVVQPYSSSVKKATTLMDMVLAGEILTEEVVKGITD